MAEICAEDSCNDGTGQHESCSLWCYANKNTDARNFYIALAARLEVEIPHAIYPTSNYCESTGSVETTKDDQTIEVVISNGTFYAIKMVDNSLHTDQPVLRDI